MQCVNSLKLIDWSEFFLEVGRLSKKLWLQETFPRSHPAQNQNTRSTILPPLRAAKINKRLHSQMHYKCKLQLLVKVPN